MALLSGGGREAQVLYPGGGEETGPPSRAVSGAALFCLQKKAPREKEVKKPGGQLCRRSERTHRTIKLQIKHNYSGCNSQYKFEKKGF
jgi:hypothetical protein